MVKGICPDILEIIEPANEGYKLTLKLDLAQIACCKGMVALQVPCNII